MEQEAASRWLEYIERCKAEGQEEPDENTLKRIEDLNSRFDLKKTKVIDIGHKELVCPKCQFSQPVAGNLRNWTAKELYEYAAVVEQLEVIAARNRSMPNLPLADVVEEVSA